MPRILNLHAVVVDTVTVNVVHPDGTTQVFELRDDIPVAVGVLGLAFAQHEKDASGDMGTVLQVFDSEATHVVGEIFRHTYPETTDDQIRQLIPPADQMEIINLFFTSLSARFKGLASNSAPSTSQPQAVEQTAERAERAEPASDSLPVEIQSPSN